MRKIEELVLRRPVNAVEFIDHIISIIEEEPKRLSMETWGARKNDHTYDTGQFPECGTMACVGGWGAISLIGKLSSESFIDVSGYKLAQIMTGCKQMEEGNLAYKLYHGIFMNEDLVVSNSYTDVLEHLRGFQDEHRETLEQVIINPIAFQEAENGE